MPSKLKVIFKKDHQIKEVKFGYAVNYLFPKGLALLASPKTIAGLEKEIKDKAEKLKNIQDETEKLAKKIDKTALKIKAKAKDKKKLFGSVTKLKIRKELEKIIGGKMTAKLPKIEIELEKPIKTFGRHQIGLKIGKSKAKVKLQITKS